MRLFVLAARLDRASFQVQAVYRIHIPVFRTGFALVLIFLGARMLMHIWLPTPVKSSAETESVMAESVFRSESTKGGALKYDAVFKAEGSAMFGSGPTIRVTAARLTRCDRLLPMIRARD